MTKARTIGTPSEGGKKIPTLVEQIRCDLRAVADPARAPGMQAYMKSQMPFLGLPTPLRRRLTVAALRQHLPGSFDEWQEAIRRLWDEAEYREERYAAVEILVWRPCAPFRTPLALPLMEHLIVTGAWWDFVDAIAAHSVGDVLQRHRKPVSRLMRRWMRHDCLWLRRAAILCQLGRKGETDLDLLYEAVEANWSDREFFIRKAIGWALRDHAWHDPAEILRYVTENAAHLSPLSRREALKNVARPPRPPLRRHGAARAGRAGTA